MTSKLVAVNQLRPRIVSQETMDLSARSAPPLCYGVLRENLRRAWIRGFFWSCVRPT